VFTNKKWMSLIALLAIAAMILPACAPPTPVVIEKEVPVEVEKIKEIEVVKEVPVEVEKEVPVERKVIETVIVEREKEVKVVVTATPEPTPVPPPEEITDFENVPEDILVQVCEDVKAAVEYDDDARTLTLHLATPFGPMMQLLSNGWASPLDMEWMAEQGDWDGDCSNWVAYHNPSAEDSVIFNVENGTGPFRLEYWRPNDEVVGVRWDDYWRTEPMWEGGPSGPAWYERVVEKEISEWGTRFAMLQAGDVDMTYVPKQYLEQVEPLVAEECDYVTEECETVNPDGTIRLFKDLPGVTGIDFFFAMDIPEESTFIGSGALDGSGIPTDFMADVNIRKAFAACFDYETFLAEVEKGEAVGRNGPIIAGMTGYDPNDPPTPTYDPEGCEAYFKAADVDHDGIPAGEDDDDVWSVGFYMMLAYNIGNDQRRVACEMLKANVEAINNSFRIDILALPWPAYLKQHTAGFIPIYRIGWLEDYHHPHNWVQPYLSKAGAYGHALSLPEDVQAEFDDMIATAKSLTDPTEQHEAYKAIQRKATEYQTSIWGPQATGRHWEQTWIEGYFYNPAFPCQFPYGLTESEDSPDPKTFIMASIGLPETLDPAYMYDTASSCWVWRFYDPLIHMNRGSYEDFVGQLADSWEISDDALTYTFHIREGVNFHEGGDLDAHDAAYAIWRGLLQDRAAGPQWMFWDALFGYETAEDYAIDKANEALGF
jgi:peptide/nickel transport system substrate-binding protein